MRAALLGVVFAFLSTGAFAEQIRKACLNNLQHNLARQVDLVDASYSETEFCDCIVGSAARFGLEADVIVPAAYHAVAVLAAENDVQIGALMKSQRTTLDELIERNSKVQHLKEAIHWVVVIEGAAILRHKLKMRDSCGSGLY
ncbi:MAG: hypothetical protein AAFY59_14745 [Pseudomonadota bacterium]